MKTIPTYLLTLCILLFNTTSLYAERVGLVLSGGGARGITHVGVIKALEEHNIPIDYVAGTSMGAIVAGMYAIGMTPDEMIELLKSDDFKRWSTGEIAQRYTFFYKSEDPSPAIIDLRLRINLSRQVDSILIKPVLPSNVISPVQMNFAFLQLFMQANAAARGNFDHLFVPFRCVASDVYRKEAVIFSEGDLGDAIRASMSIPFVFKPIEVDGRLLFDGGIYNNFPVDVMVNHFNPDFIIGSVVSFEPEQPTLENPATQLLSLVMSPTHFEFPDEGLLLQFDLRGQPHLDFSPVDQLVELGYTQTIARMDEIRKRVNREVSAEEVAARRADFRKTFPEIRFQNVHLTGIDEQQQAYVRRIFRRIEENAFDLETFKRGYFELVADDRIYEVIPHATFNEESGYFDLHLHVIPETNVRLRIGGNISSSTSNQVFIGIQHQVLRNFASTSNLDMQLGKTYNGLQLGTRVDFLRHRDLYIRARFVTHRYDYFEGFRFFYQNNPTSAFSQGETFMQVQVGKPFTQKGRMELGVGAGFLNDKYMQNRDLQAERITPDRSRYFVSAVSSQIETHTLNRVMYPTRGTYTMLSVKGVYGRESFTSALSPENNIAGKSDLWLQLNGKYEHYIPLSRRFTLGTYGEFALSTRPFSQNYTATIIQAPRFAPTPFSKTVFNEAFAANRFAAVGAKPIFKLSNTVSLRNETYLFLPLRTIEKDANGMAVYSEPFTSFQYMSELSLVVDIRGVSISFFGNYFSSGASRWNFGINIGSLLFNERFLK